VPESKVSTLSVLSKISATKAAFKNKANKAKVMSDREESRRKKEETENAIKLLKE